MTYSVLFPHHLSFLLRLLLYICLWLHKDWDCSLETVCLFCCLSVIPDLQLPLQSQLHVFFSPRNLSVPAFLSSPGHGFLHCWLVPHVSTLAGSTAFLSQTLSRMVLHQLSFEELTCVQLKIFPILSFNLGYLDHFLPPHSLGGPQRGSCLVFYTVFRKEGFELLWNEPRTVVHFKCVGKSKPSKYWLEAVNDLCAWSWPQDNYFKISAIIVHYNK